MPNPPSGSESWSGSSAAAVREAVIDALRSGASAVCVTGGVRSGKTTLCRDLAGSVDDRSFSTAVFDPTLDPDGVLRQLLADFGLAAGGDGPAQTHQSLSGAVVRFLKSLKPLGAHALIVIDDADQVGVDVLTMLTSVAREAGNDALRLVLVGQPSLAGRLLDPPLRDFPGTSRTWTRVGLPLDDALVPVIPPESPYVAAIEPELEESSVQQPTRWHVPVLVGLLVVAAAAWWWTSRGPSSASLSPAPAATLPAASQPPASPPGASPNPGAGTPVNATPAGNTVAPAESVSIGAPPASPPAAASPSASAASAAQVAPAPVASGDGPYRITVASFRTATRAEEIAASLRQQLTVATRADATGSWHQVIAGPYPSIERAREAQRVLERAGFPDTQITMLAPPSR